MGMLRSMTGSTSAPATKTPTRRGIEAPLAWFNLTDDLGKGPDRC